MRVTITNFSIILIFSILITHFKAFSQKRSMCGYAEPSSQEKSQLLNFFNASQIKSQNLRTTGTNKVKVKVTLFKSSSQALVFTEADVIEMINYANAFLSNATVELVLVNNSVQIINDDVNFDFLLANQKNIRSKYDVTNAVNIYLFRTIQMEDKSLLNGYTLYPNLSQGSNAIFCSYYDGSNEDKELLKHKVFLHEIGHYFGLLHTFQDSNNADITKRELVTRGAGANCSSTGDQLCDTNADPFERLSVMTAYDCTEKVSLDIVDANGEQYTPPISNIMSYNLHCGQIFTAQQYQKMMASFATRFSPYAEYQITNTNSSFISIISTNKKTYCVGEKATVNFSTIGTLDTSNSYLLEISDKDGLNYQKVEAIKNGDALEFYIPQNLIESDNYHLRITSSSPKTQSPISEAFSIKTLSSVTLTAEKSTMYLGESNYLNLNFVGTGPWSFELSNGTVVKDNKANPYVIPISPQSTTTYYMVLGYNSCGITTKLNSTVVNVLSPKIMIDASFNTNLCKTDLVNVPIVGLNTAMNYVIQLYNGATFVEYPTTNKGSSLVFQISSTLISNQKYKLRVLNKTTGEYSYLIDVTAYDKPVAPTVIAQKDICFGSVTQALSAEGTKLKWYYGESDISYYDKIFPSSGKAGKSIYYVSQTAEVSGCESKKSLIEVNVKPAVTGTISGDKIITLGDSTHVSINLTGESPWTLTLSDGKVYTTTARNTNYTIKPLRSSIYELSNVKNPCGNGFTSGRAKITVLEPLANESELKDNINIFPNPTSDIIRIKLTGIPLKKGTSEILDLRGITVAQSLLEANKDEHFISIVDLKEGEYILRIVIDDKIYSQRIIKSQ